MGGSPRSGTTLLQSILCSAPGTTPMMAECAPLRFLLESCQKTVGHTKVNPGDYFDGKQGVVRLYTALCKHFLNDVRARHDANVAVLKEPAMGPSLPLLLDTIPDALIIAIARDPRSIVLSMREWGRRSRDRGADSHFESATTAELAEEVANAYRQLTRLPAEFAGDRIFFLRYEDLVHEPLWTSRVLAAVTGLDLSNYNPSAGWDVAKMGFGSGTPRDDAKTPLYGKKVAATRVSAWRTDLAPEDIAEIEEVASFYMSLFGYEKAGLQEEACENPD
ncbi:MAG: sulfotransferase [Phycisphaerales bacterium]|nr:sulfotransferase [Phycisphaerales bacterium]